MLALARGLSRLAFRLSARSRRVALANLDLVFGDRYTLKEKERLARHSLYVFSLVLLDLFWFSIRTPQRIARWVEVDEALRDPARHTGPHLCVTGHYGNWELMGQVAALLGYRLVSVAAPIGSPLVDSLLIGLRRKTGQVIVPKQGALRRLMAELREGAKVAVLLDQNVKPSQGGIFVDFFGLPVPVSEAASLLAVHYRCPVMFPFCVPLPDGRYRMFLFDLLPMPEGQAKDPDGLRAHTQLITGVMEKVIREQPEHWLWSYKRWKHMPPGSDESLYPFYRRHLNEKDLKKLRD